ncbi:hypothetical protein DWB77_05374 [Streptomyces hundungensis]|uniref:DUF2330 domain-containing protein n=1 Tax=Streptomyces hundungensis TaxID=1077946 RepID=A0A387HPZ9_9ACTN|nr:DUF2330 domain-containing protein [Streptomyces hundungensis]AYG83178.1 hypothetical protein DWB77_05374 [Streptomyces hundungensis]
MRDGTGRLRRTGDGRRPWRRVLLVALALVALQLGSLVAPAYACGCGAMVPQSGRQLSVRQETSAVRWDGHHEQIVMRLTVDGNAPQAAWIMPVPSRATVKLGDRQLFDELERLSAPVHRTRTYFWPRSGDWPLARDRSVGDGAPRPAAKPPVEVVGRERLGPFDVARLTASDPTALRDWLSRNGFQLPPALSTELRPYVDQKWEYVAIRLAPDRPGRALGGPLDPLSLSFASDRLIYPMRLSRLAKTPQTLDLYVLADHRMETASTIGGDRPETLFAGDVEHPSGPLAELTGGTGPVYLTALTQFFTRPSRITGDHELTRAADDTGFQRTWYTDELMTVGGAPLWLVTVGGALAVLLAGALGTVLAVRGRRRRRGDAQLPEPVSHSRPA